MLNRRRPILAGNEKKKILWLMARTKQTMRPKGNAAVKRPRFLAAKKPRKLRNPQRRRFRPGTVALREIRKQQQESGTLIPFSTFRNILKTISREHIRNDIRWESEAVECLLAGSEAEIIELFQDALMCALHAHRQTILPRDLVLARILRGKLSRSRFEPPPPSEPFTADDVN